MEQNASAASGDKNTVLHHWSARKLQPIVLLYTAAVFVAMMAVAHFGLHSVTAVKALALGTIGFCVPLVPMILSRMEYRLTEGGLERRPFDEKEPKEFKSIFQFDQLSHIVPMRFSFKFYRHFDETNPIRRFWKTHVSDAYSGEVLVEKADQNRVLEILAEQGIPRR